jgi:hypothetical protein
MIPGMEAARTSVGKVAATAAPRQTRQPDRTTEDDFHKELNKQRAVVRSAQARTQAPTPSATAAGAPSALKMVPPAPTGPAADPAAGAQHVLDTGRRALLVDNYEARMEAFAAELQKGDAPYRLRLMQEILKRDPRALGSWLTPERANTLHAQGHVTTEQRAAMAESLASAFNHGVLKANMQDAGQRPGRPERGRVAVSELDNAFWGFGPPGSGSNRLENARNVRNLLDFFGSSSGPEMQAFRTNYGRHLIDQYVLNDAVGYHNSERRDAAAGLAANLLAGDTRHPDIATDVLGSYDFAQVRTIMESAARSNNLYAADALRPYAHGNVDPRGSSLPNGSALLMHAVALSRSAKADAVAASLAKLPANAPSIFDKRHHGGKDNVDALTLVVANHANAVLDSRTRYDQTYIGDADNPNLQQYMVNGAELGALFSTTLFNPDSTYRDTLQDAVTQYAGELERTVNQPGPNRDAAGRLAMLSAALTDAVRQDNMELAKNEAARKQLLGMVVDIALAGLPLGKWTSSAAEKLIAQAFTGQGVQDALKGLSGTLIDTATGQLTDKAKAQIVDALGKDNGNAEIAKNLANSLHDGIFNQISEADYDKEFMQNAYTAILSGIQLSRLPGGTT